MGPAPAPSMTFASSKRGAVPTIELEYNVEAAKVPPWLSAVEGRLT